MLRVIILSPRVVQPGGSVVARPSHTIVSSRGLFYQRVGSPSTVIGECLNWVATRPHSKIARGRCKPLVRFGATESAPRGLPWSAPQAPPVGARPGLISVSNKSAQNRILFEWWPAWSECARRTPPRTSDNASNSARSDLVRIPQLLQPGRARCRRGCPNVNKNGAGLLICVKQRTPAALRPGEPGGGARASAVRLGADFVRSDGSGRANFAAGLDHVSSNVFVNFGSSNTLSHPPNARLVQYRQVEVHQSASRLASRWL
jgi:hypothetical protein